MKQKTNSLVSKKQLLFLLAVLIISITLALVFPDRREPFADASLRFFLEMVFILPAISVLIGLFNIFIPKNLITQHLGKASGIQGFVLAIFLGALPTGPLYIAFPIAAALLSKGARIANIIVFLTAWACIKLPQEMVELSFLGPAFTALRLVLSITAAAVMGLVTEHVIEGKKARG